jgi:carboxypeptidase family protein
MTFVRSFAGLTILMAGLATPAAAQGTADIVGRVTDPGGGALPGATVTARDLATNIARTTATSGTGDYTFTALPVGAYEVKTESSGFKTETSRVTLATGDRARVDVKLQLGAVSESVVVTGDVQQLQTDESHVASQLNRQIVESVPIVGRNIVNIIQLTPGAAEGQATATISGNRPDDRRQTSAVAINGMRENENRQMVDGVDNEERVMGGMGIKPSLEAIQEVNVKTNSYSADNGRTLSAVINIVTKSGTNEFHGSAYEFLRNQNFDARSFFAPTRPLNHQNQFGGSLGGPIKKDKTFFFVDYDQDRINNQTNFVETVPTTRMHTGDFSELPSRIYDPLTGGPGRARTPFDGNKILPSQFDSRAVNLMALYPLPNLPGLANNYAYNGPGQQTNQTTDVRIDHHFNTKDSIFGRYSYNLTNGVTPSQCPPAQVLGHTFDPTCNTGGVSGIYSGPYHTFAHNAVGNWLRVWGPTLITQVTYNFSRPLTSASRPSANPANAATLFGFQNVNYTSDPITGGLPWFEMHPLSYAAIGDPTFLPMETEDHNHQIEGSITKTKSAHSIKIGGGVIFRLFGVQQSQYPRSTWQFDSSLTNNGSGSGGNTFASFLLGYPALEQRTHFPIHPLNRTKEPNVYIQDDWRATSWLTLNLGLRYEIFTPLTEAENRIAGFRPALGRIVVASPSDPTVGVQTDYSNIGPRAGFAASLPGKFVFRSGMGIVYDPILRGGSSFLKNPPFTENFGPLTSAGSAGGLPNLFLSDVPPPLAFGDPTNPAGVLSQPVTTYKSPRSIQFNGFLEKQLGGFVISAGYVGHRADRMPINQNINLPPVGPGPVQSRRPYFSQYPLLTNITMISNLGEMTYDSGQFKVDRRYSKGLTLSSSLTWAHAQQNSLLPWDQHSFTWGNIPTYDIRFKWVGIASYELPWGGTLHGVAHGFLAGWQTNFVAFWSTGLDYSIVNASPQTNVGATTDGTFGGRNGDSPNLIGDPNSGPNIHTVQRWFNTAAFALQPAFTVGNLGPGTMHGPPQRRLDIALSKSLHVRERQTVQIRVESFNVTNTASFQPPDGNFGSTTFGSISSTGNAPPRQMQFGVKYLF